jgi:O-antigen biosynthesis protein
MRFLITCYTLGLSGSSTYTFTLASELKKKGHTVEIFCPIPQQIAEELRKKDIKVYATLAEIVNQNYSCIIAQHNVFAMMARSVKPETPMIFISHGILPFLEHPPSIDINIQQYVAVSEKVKENLVLNYGIDPEKVTIVRNFVDVNRYFPQTEINESPKTILFMSNNQNARVLETIQKACERLQIKLIGIGGTNQTLNTEDFINQADIVISLGRGILEAMACGRAVIVYDYAGGDGIVTPETIGEIRKYNFSGRIFARDYSVDDLIQEIGKYKQSMGKINREIIIKEYNAALNPDQIITICNKAIERFHPRSVAIPCKELFWCQNSGIPINPGPDVHEVKARQELATIQKSHGWKMLLRYYALRDRLLPAGSTRRKIIKAFYLLIFDFRKFKACIKGTREGVDDASKV